MNRIDKFIQSKSDRELFLAEKEIMKYNDTGIAPDGSLLRLWFKKISYTIETEHVPFWIINSIVEHEIARRWYQRLFVSE